MTFYWALLYFLCAFFLSLLLFKLSVDLKRVLLLFGLLLLYLAVIFRPPGVADTLNYQEIFIDWVSVDKNYTLSRFDQLFKKDYSTAIEYGFLYLTQFIKKYISSNVRVYFGVVAALEFILFGRFCSQFAGKEINKKIAIVYFVLPYIGYMYLLVTIRAGLAFALVLNGFSATKGWNKKSRKHKNGWNVLVAVFFYFAGFIVHRLTIIMLLCEVIYYFIPILKKRTYWILWVISGILEFMNSTALQKNIKAFLENIGSKVTVVSSYTHYFPSEIEGGGGIAFRRIFFWIIAFFVLFFLNKPKESDETFRFLNRLKEPNESHRFLNIYMFGLLIMPLLSFVSGASRITDYIMFFAPLLLFHVHYNHKDNNGKGLMVLFEFLYGVLGTTIITRL